MGQNAKKPAHRGVDVTVRLFKKGRPLDVIEAEEIDLQPQIHVVESNVLSVGFGTRDTHGDGWQVNVKGVKKSNNWLNEMRAQMNTNLTSGAAFDNYTAVIKYRDLNSGTHETVKLVECAVISVDQFSSGGMFGKQSEGFSLHGHEPLH